MLKQLVIHNIVLIERLVIDFSDGLCVLTGETGAGKSILMDALMFSLGSRASQRLLRHGADKGTVTAEFDINKNSAVAMLLREHDVPLEDTILLRRVIDAQGKSKAYINDTPVGQQLLARCGALLVEIHGQHDQKTLFSSSFHRQWLDAYAQTEKELAVVAEAFDVYRQAQGAYDDFMTKLHTIEKERAYLLHAQEELGRWELESGTEERLSLERQRLQNSEKLLGTLSDLQQIIGDGSLSSQLQSAQSILFKNSSLDESFDKINECLERASIEVQEAEHMIDMLGKEVESPEQTLEDIEEHLFALRGMARKYGVEVDELPQYLRQVEVELEQLEDSQASTAQLEKALHASKEAYLDAAAILSEKRRIGALALEHALEQELIPLKMEKTRFKVELAPVAEESWSREGVEKIAFLVSTNPGAPLGPLTKVASGGELSRLMLALKVLAHQTESVTTMIFDEIDTGIGGAVADAVGKRLFMLGKTVQLLIITHQPQVAAYGRHHYRVSKIQRQEQTLTTVEVLTGDMRRDELARMLSGAEVTNEAQHAANKLLEALPA